jgi:TPR repeat protein
MARFDFSAEDVVDVAAQSGGADALFQLGLMYCAGRDVDVDLVQAHKWFNLAAMRGNEEAKSYRLELSREMTKQQVAAAQKSAREWLKLH